MAARMRHEELERQVFIANGIAQGLAEEKRDLRKDHWSETRKIKRDFETEARKMKQDFETETQSIKQNFEIELERLRGENRECLLMATYDSEKATRESFALKDEVATLRARLIAKEDEYAKEDTAGTVPLGASKPPLSNEGLQAENTRLKAEVDKLTTSGKLMGKNLQEAQRMVGVYEVRIPKMRDRTKALRENAESLGRDVASYRDSFKKMSGMRKDFTEAQAAIYLDAQKSTENAQLLQRDYEERLEREMNGLSTTLALLQSRVSSARKTKDHGLQATSAARAKSEAKWSDIRSRIDRSYNDSVHMARKILEEQPTTVLTPLEKPSNRT